MWEDGSIHAERRWAAAVAQLGKCPGIIIDLGGRVPFEGYLKREFLGATTIYVCVDIDLSARPNLAGDAGHIPIATGSVAGLLCNAVLEHVPEPHRVVDEIYRITKPGAPVLVSVPFMYPYHDRADYFRFSDDGLRYLFRKFTEVDLVPLGDYAFAVTAILTGFSPRATRWLSPFTRLIRRALLTIAKQRARSGSGGRNLLRSLEHTAVGWYVYMQKPIDSGGTPAQ
jgi:SAM-dependent methyltransferase